MSITINIYYSGTNGNAKSFAEAMLSSGIAAMIRKEDGNEQYEYFSPFESPEMVLLIDKWRDQKALDAHHASPLMAQIAQLRDKYDLHMKVERYSSESSVPITDEKYIRK